MKNNDLFTKTLLLAAILSTTFILSVAKAEVPGITTGAQLQAEAEKRTKIINTEELKKELDENLDMILVDIRLPSEIKSMGGAIKANQNRNIPRGWLEYRITSAALSKDTPIVVYCGAGIRTPMAADTLQKMGYTNVRNYSDGYLGWKKAGLPTAQ
jgi:rhodanese-related sulfurtransferase